MCLVMLSRRTTLLSVIVILSIPNFYVNWTYYVRRKKPIENTHGKVLPLLMHVKTQDREDISCKLLIAGDEREILRAHQLGSQQTNTGVYDNGNQRSTSMVQHRSSVQSKTLLALTQNCSSYVQVRGFINRTVDGAEASFPLAFSMMVYRDARQVERLLRAVWRPHNYYCIHVDTKSTADFRRAMKGVARCFNNVYVHPEPLSVSWGSMSVLKAELLCMKLLLKKSETWKYFINLTGQEFPLKTNYELYLILKALNGSNEIFGRDRRFDKHRYRRAPPPPHGMKPLKGPVHVAPTRAFVEYAVHAAPARDLLEWLGHTEVPDETFFATLNYNSHLAVPGSYTGNLTEEDQWSGFVRYKIWRDRRRCAGKFVRDICVFAVGDLPRLTSAVHMFANKFMYDYDPLAYNCLEQWYFHKVEREREGEVTLNTSIYSSRLTVKHHFP